MTVLAVVLSRLKVLAILLSRMEVRAGMTIRFPNQDPKEVHLLPAI